MIESCVEMTRINVVPVEELSDQWLLAEYRELPRVIKTDRVYIGDAPERYKLGKGHVKFMVKHAIFCLNRYAFICDEMEYRGFKVNYPYEDLDKLADDKQIPWYSEVFIPDKSDIQINRHRLIEKYRMKPEFYKWTNRTKPEWLN